MPIRFGHVSLLEISAVTVSSAAAGFEAVRLYDRFLGRNWKATGTAEQVIQADQGAGGGQGINALIVPAGHNLLGCTLHWEHSDNGTAWTPAVASWAGAAGLIFKECAGAVHRYWRMRIAGASSAPYMGECFMTEMVAPVSAVLQDYRHRKHRNVSRSESRGGVASYLRFGNARKARDFTMPGVNASDRAILEAWVDSWDGCKPFFFEDPDGQRFFAELVREIEWADAPTADNQTARFSILEVL
jgi:hypothetical protein